MISYIPPVQQEVKPGESIFIELVNPKHIFRNEFEKKDARYFMDRSTFEKFYQALTAIQVIVGLINDESFRFWIFHFLIFTILAALLLIVSNHTE